MCNIAKRKGNSVKIQELRNLSKEELIGKEKTLKDQMFKLNMQRYSGRVEKPHMFSLLKRDIARIQTILNAKDTLLLNKRKRS
ncbi:50S ribosomal protein L29 [bacterium]|nr:MAG: 50S ribosomal protein L29 [bacterium]